MIASRISRVDVLHSLVAGVVFANAIGLPAHYLIPCLYPRIASRGPVREALRALDAYVGDRTSGPLFLNAGGTQRLSYSIAYKLIGRLARKAKIPAADRITPERSRFRVIRS